MLNVRHALLVLMSLSFSGQGMAMGVATGFSAEAIQKAPMRKDYRAMMFVSKDAVRTESFINNVPVVEIMNSGKNFRVLLVAKDKIYMQQIKSVRTGNKGLEKSEVMNPCEGLMNTSCRKIATETVNNRETEKWQFTVTRNGQDYNSLHWIDVQYQMPIREFLHNGTVMELTMSGPETLHGRKTEKWSMLITHADGQTISVIQWYDLELKIMTREEMPGGFVRELVNIKTGKQDKDLFEIPAGYTQVEKLPDYLNMSPGYGQANPIQH